MSAVHTQVIQEKHLYVTTLPPPQVSDCFKMKTNPLKDAKQLKLRVCVMYCSEKKRTVVSTSNGSSVTSVTTTSVDTSNRWQRGPETEQVTEMAAIVSISLWREEKDLRQIIARGLETITCSRNMRSSGMFWKFKECFFVCFVVVEDELELMLIKKQFWPSNSKHSELTAEQWLLCRKWACLRKENRAGKSAPQPRSWVCSCVDLRMWAGNHHFPWTALGFV